MTMSPTFRELNVLEVSSSTGMPFLVHLTSTLGSPTAPHLRVTLEWRGSAMTDLRLAWSVHAGGWGGVWRLSL